MKGTFKHTVSLFIILAMLFSISVPALATDVETPIGPIETNNSGYRTGSFYLGGVPHNYTATLGGNTTSGAYSSVSVLDSTIVSRRHNNLYVIFRTSDSGNQPGTGGYVNLTCSGTSNSYYVKYTRGMSYVTGFNSIRGTIDIFGDSTHSISLAV